MNPLERMTPLLETLLANRPIKALAVFAGITRRANGFAGGFSPGRSPAGCGNNPRSWHLAGSWGE
ncbi:hypothetical protein TRIP_B330649 [uncultured Desulfatiglans sp.]|nr:hypothetical protein TRIP_B330649 [uncultured Desulfatiglans sp.]